MRDCVQEPCGIVASRARAEADRLEVEAQSRHPLVSTPVPNAVPSRQELRTSLPKSVGSPAGKSIPTSLEGADWVGRSHTQEIDPHPNALQTIL